MNNNPEKIYDNIFEAFKHFAPSSWLLELENEVFQPCVKSNRYELVDMEDGHFTAFSGGMWNQLYRGEHGKYATCEASIFRNNCKNDIYNELHIMIDKIKLIDFRNIVMTFPQTKMASKDLMKVDYLALAQHYELNTNLIDYTSEPEIAAYFATQKWIDGVPHPMTEGLGCIYGTMPPLLEPKEQMRNRIFSDKFHMIGLQCFRRSGLQSAYGIETDMGEDVSNNGWKVYFKQTKKASEHIHMNFHVDERIQGITQHSWLFPEEEIADVAKLIKKAKCVTNQAVKEYCEDYNLLYDEIVEKITSVGYKVTINPVFELSASRILELTREYADRPYVDVKLTSRLICHPPYQT